MSSNKNICTLTKKQCSLCQLTPCDFKIYEDSIENYRYIIADFMNSNKSAFTENFISALKCALDCMDEKIKEEKLK